MDVPSKHNAFEHRNLYNQKCLDENYEGSINLLKKQNQSQKNYEFDSIYFCHIKIL